MLLPADRSLTRRGWLKAGGLALAGLAVASRPAWAQPAPLVRLGLNENPLGPSPLVDAAIRDNLRDLHAYTTEAEAQALIRQIADFEGVKPEQIVLGEILEPMGLRLGQKAGVGGEYIYSVPGYPALVNAAASVGGKVISVPLNAELENDLPAIATAVTARTGAIFIVNPHNPSGTVNGAATFHAFLRETSKRTLVIVDEAYLEYSDDYAGRTAIPHTRAGANVLVFRTMAKVYGLASLPMGYAVAPLPIAELLRSTGVGFYRDLNRLAVVAAGAALRDQAQVARVRAIVTQERNAWKAELVSLGLRQTASQANFVYFDAGRAQTEIAQAMAREGIDVGRGFAPYDRWVRIAIGRPEDNARARAALRRVLAVPA